MICECKKSYNAILLFVLGMILSVTLHAGDLRYVQREYKQLMLVSVAVKEFVRDWVAKHPEGVKHRRSTHYSIDL